MDREGMNRKKNVEIAVLGALVLAALGVWYFSSRPPAGVARASTVANYKPMRVENPQIHWERLAEAQNTEYKPSPRDIFSRDLPPPPPKPVHVPGPGDNDYVAPPPPPPPPPPQLPLKYFGEGQAQAGAGRRAFRSDGASVFIVPAGDIVLCRYRIIKIIYTNIDLS